MRAASCSSGSNDVRYCDGKRIFVLVVVVAVDKYWALAEGQVGLFATDGRLPVIGQRKIETPAAAKNKETSCAYDQHGRQPLSRATQQGHSSAAPFSRCVRVAAIAFLSPPARLPCPHDMKDGRMAGEQNDMSISQSISRSN